MMAVTNILSSDKFLYQSRTYRVVPQIRSTLRQDLIFWQNISEKDSLANLNTKLVAETRKRRDLEAANEELLRKKQKFEDENDSLKQKCKNLQDQSEAKQYDLNGPKKGLKS